LRTQVVFNSLGVAIVFILFVGAVIPLSVILATTGRSSRRRDRHLEEDINNIPPCNCSGAVNITIPQSMFIASSTVEQNITSGGGPTPVVYGSITTKLLPLLSGMNLTTGVFTAPEDGLYEINWFVGAPSPAGGTPTTVVFGSVSISNWPSEIVNINLPDTGFFTPFSGGLPAILQAGDTVVITFINASGFLLTLNAGSSLAVTKVNDIP
jgi:hypothetical protein